MSIDTSGRVIQGWNPEDEAAWDKSIAWRTLSITTFSMILAFAVCPGFTCCSAYSNA